MSTSLKDAITADMKAAMKNKDKDRLATIRLIMAAVKQREVDEQITLNDDQVLAVLNKMIKQRRDSIKQFEEGNRPDLAAKEAAEVDVIQNYLPEQLSEADVETAVTAAIAETGAAGPKDMGKVMGILKSKLAGTADMSLVSNKVKEKLAG